MIELIKNGVYLVNGTELVADDAKAGERLAMLTGRTVSREEASAGTMAAGILKAHNTSGDDGKLQMRFDRLISHDITFVGIIQTARASGLTQFPMPYALTNCHNSLCAVGGTINEDDHMFGLSCAKKYGGIYVPPHIAVIHQFAREMMAGCGRMILGSDSHTRYGALGTLAVGEGGPELVKQLLGRTYDIDRPEVVAIYLTGKPVPGVGPQDIALAIIGAVFKNGFVKNKVMEFVGPGIAGLSVDFRIGVDVMTTETTCLSSIWVTDDRVKEFYEIHGRSEDYSELKPAEVSWYDSAVKVDLSTIRPMIAMPFHPSNVFTIEELKDNLEDILEQVEENAAASLGGSARIDLRSKIKDGSLMVDQGVIAGCAGGGFENLCDVADILDGQSIGADAFSLSVYPASQPVYMELVKNGSIAKIMETGATIRTAFCGPCFGAGDVPANNGFSIRHSTRNFPNREGSKPANGQIASVALMDARSIAATAVNGGRLTAATELDVNFTRPKYFFDSRIYERRVYNGVGKADSSIPLQMGPNIKDWPPQVALTDDILLRVVSEIHDPVTTTDELIPSGETSSFRSNPLGLAEFTLSRRDPEYVGRAKLVREAEEARRDGRQEYALKSEIDEAFTVIRQSFPQADQSQTEIGSAIYAVKPGDGSAREQAASCQRVLGGVANIAREYATKRYRSNVINWGMIPFIFPEEELPFANLDYLYIPGIRRAIRQKAASVQAYTVSGGRLVPFTLEIKPLTDAERQIILDGCLINYYREQG